MMDIRKRWAVVALPLVGFSAASFAAVPVAFTTAVTDVTADGAAMAGALVGVAAAVVIVMIAVKFVRRLKGTV
jgi:hypothetical protein